MVQKFQYKRPIQVYCKKCKEYIDENKVTFVNIEEDNMGFDKLTFICPNCKSEQTSSRLG